MIFVRTHPRGVSHLAEIFSKWLLRRRFHALPPRLGPTHHRLLNVVVVHLRGWCVLCDGLGLFVMNLAPATFLSHSPLGCTVTREGREGVNIQGAGHAPRRLVRACPRQSEARVMGHLVRGATCAVWHAIIIHFCVPCAFSLPSTALFSLLPYWASLVAYWAALLLPTGFLLLPTPTSCTASLSPSLPTPSHSLSLSYSTHLVTASRHCIHPCLPASPCLSSCQSFPPRLHPLLPLSHPHRHFPPSYLHPHLGSSGGSSRGR